MTTRNDSLCVLCHFIAKNTESCLAVVYRHSTNQIATLFIGTVFQQDLKLVHSCCVVPNGNYSIAIFGFTASRGKIEKYPSALEHGTIVHMTSPHGGDEGKYSQKITGTCILQMWCSMQCVENYNNTTLLLFS